jgi:two-component system phosphate regulon sensor histidine kinase PhoR
VDKSRSREKGGTGLGLAIVKHILEGHNSTIEVESELGEGSLFVFSLPRGKE